LRENDRAQTKVPTRRKSVLPDISKIGGAREGLLPGFLEPSLASLCDTPPTGPKWVHEIKYDGYRMQARIDGQDIRLLTRKKLDWTKRFRSIAVALEELRIASPCSMAKSLSKTQMGSRVSTKHARSLRADIEKVASTKPTFGKGLPAGADKGVRWAEPRLVCQIEYRGWTHDGLLRAPSFKGLREDKPAEEIVLEETTKLRGAS
jgi:ATP-dependent DNA ligase